MMNGQTQGTARSQSGFWSEMVNNARLAWRLMTDSRVATWTKLVVPAVMGAYLLWPVDLLPDLFPVLGQVDDLAVLLLSVRLFIQLCPADVVEEHRRGLGRTSSAQADAPGPATGDEVIDAQYRVVESR